MDSIAEGSQRKSVSSDDEESLENVEEQILKAQQLLDSLKSKSDLLRSSKEKRKNLIENTSEPGSVIKSIVSSLENITKKLDDEVIEPKETEAEVINGSPEADGEEPKVGSIKLVNISQLMQSSSFNNSCIIISDSDESFIKSPKSLTNQNVKKEIENTSGLKNISTGESDKKQPAVKKKFFGPKSKNPKNKNSIRKTNRKDKGNDEDSGERGKDPLGASTPQKEESTNENHTSSSEEEVSSKKTVKEINPESLSFKNESRLVKINHPAKQQENDHLDSLTPQKTEKLNEAQSSNNEKVTSINKAEKKKSKIGPKSKVETRLRRKNQHGVNVTESSESSSEEILEKNTKKKMLGPKSKLIEKETKKKAIASSEKCKNTEHECAPSTSTAHLKQDEQLNESEDIDERRKSSRKNNQTDKQRENSETETTKEKYKPRPKSRQRLHLAKRKDEDCKRKETYIMSDIRSVIIEAEKNLKQLSPNKSILKTDLNRTATPEKRVQFSKNASEKIIYPKEGSSSESSSEEEDDSDDEDFAVPGRKPTKAKNSINYSKEIKSDAKFFAKCVVNINRLSDDNLKCKSDLPESTPKSDTTMNNNVVKRSRSSRDQENLSSDSEESKNITKKSKTNGKESSNGVNETLQDVSTEKDSEKDETPKKAKKTSKSKKSNIASDSSDSEIEKNQAKKKKLTKRRVLSDSEDSAGEQIAEETLSSSSESEKEHEVEKPKSKRSRIKKVAASSDEDEEKTTRKQIRKVIDRDSLAETTKQAEKEERERKARIAERQEKYNNIFDADKLENSTLTKVVLDVDEETKEEVLSVHPDLVKHLKPHQGKGIQFMWDACFESLERVQNTDGSGCILAHCMGLGKTLQVIGLVHTLIANRDKTNVERVLVVCPLSTVLNWVAEFRQWLPDDDEVQVYNLVAFKQNRERVCHVMDWYRNGGALILGYDMFRNLSNETNKRMPKKMRLDFQKALVDPGPHLVVCDEGHLLKNEKTSISKAMNRLKTLRRIVLTGTPLQNNLKEYYCMVQFVKPNLLGTYKEYLNRFVNPITNGQYTDSTQHDINVMRRRAHVLHKMLDGIVQRRDYSVLEPFLPPKNEYILFVSLTDVQVKLYSHYLQNFAQRSSGTRTSFLFTDFQEFQRICTHPRVLLDKSIQNRIAQEKRDWENEEDDSEGSLKDFLDDSESDAKSTSSENSGSDDETAKEKEKEKPDTYRRRTRAMAESNPIEDEEPVATDNNADEWWSQFTSGDELDNLAHSGKLSLLFEILHQCELMGDKVLIFSQSLYSLNVIEYFLGKIDEATQNGDLSMVKGYASSWSLGLDYFRLDGSSSCDNRAAWCKTFNDPENTRARLFLISTRAGGLGINLVAANRVIIFDVSWNPSHDIQSIYRVYRFGQIKPCYIYRFVTMGTMEMKIYERQVTKQAISKRVIDEQQIDRHYNQNDLQELYKFDPKPEGRLMPVPPKDILLGELLQDFPDLIYKYHEHQSLLENKEDEVLNEEERRAAWEEFENEKKLVRSSAGTHINNVPIHKIVTALTNIIRRENPTYTNMELNGVMSQAVAELRGQVANGELSMFNKVLGEIEMMQALQQHRVQEYYQQQQQFWMMRQLQSQFPGLSPADIQTIVQAQMMKTLATPAALTAAVTAAVPPQPATGAPKPNASTSHDVINLED